MTTRRMRATIGRAIALAVSSPLIFAIPVTAKPLTFDAALRLAEKSAPSLQAKAADVGSARSAAVAAGRLPDPKLRVGFENIPISGPPAGSFTAENMTMATVGITQDMPNAGKRKADRLAAAADIDVANANAAVEARQVRLTTALAWVDLYYARRKLAALDAAGQAIASIGVTAPSQLATGAIRPAQSLEADQLNAELADRRADLVADVARAQAELVRWTGDDTADVAGYPPEFPVNASDLRANLDHNPSLLPFGATVQRAQAAVAMARADKRPDWGWDVAYEHRDPRWGDMVSGGVSISLPLFSKTRQDPVIDAKSGEATSARLDLEAAHRQLQAQLSADLADHVMHHDRLLRAQTTLVPLAEKKVQLETASYAAGTASLADVQQAQLGLAEAHIDALSREADVVRDGVRINFTYGADPQ
jgi:cobalt-zinc-cadmium efflux system outer membrane protein